MWDQTLQCPSDFAQSLLEWLTSWKDLTVSPTKPNTQRKPFGANILAAFFLNGCIFITVITFTRCSLLKSAVKGEGQKRGNDVRATLKWLLETKSIAVCYCWEISNTFESFWAKSGFIFNQNSTVYEDLVPLRYSKCCSNIQSVQLPQISRGPFQTQLLCDMNEVREY